MSWLITGSQPVPVDPIFNNVSLLLHGNGTNGSTTITDSSPTSKTVTAVGNAQISTAIADPFGNSTGVIAFDGAGDYLQSSSNGDFAFESNSYTVELWLRFATVTNINEFVTTATTVVTGRWTLYYASGSLFTGAVGGAGGTTVAWTPSPNTWYHLAVTRDAANSQRIFIDGTLAGTATSANNYTQSGLTVGTSLGGQFLNGYIDDLRITKGVARYTANFTPPTAPFPDI